MCVSLLIGQEPALGTWVRSLRIYLELTQQDLAGLAEVTPEEVNRLEHDRPLTSEAKRRILRELLSRRSHNWDRRSNC